jgi:hypothetical protein
VVMTFQRVFYNDFHPRSTKLSPAVVHGKTVQVHALIPHGILANYPIHWFLEADLIVLGVSLVLFFGALVVFGHLEGNFAEEL